MAPMSSLPTGRSASVAARLTSRAQVLSLRQELIDLDASGDDRICVDNLFDLSAMVDDYKVYVERGGGPEEPGGALDGLMMTADPVQSGFTV